jgi:predicted  nucleic acid-binding Zn-ribbon protein
MAGPAQVLKEIHRLRRHARDLQDQIDRAPRLLAVQKGKVTRQEDILHDAQESIKKMKVTNHEKEVTLRTKVQQIAKHEKQLNESKGKKEYDALQAEINHDKKECSDLEDEILNGIMDVEERTAKLPELEANLKKAKQELLEFEASSQSRHAGLLEQLAQAMQELKGVEESLPADIRSLYERQLAARNEDAMAAVRGRTCVACYTEITAQNYNELLMGQFVICKSCGRILYLAE